MENKIIEQAKSNQGVTPLRCPYCGRLSYPTRAQPRIRCSWCDQGFNVQPHSAAPWYEQAIKDLNHALAVKGDLLLAYHNLGLAYSEIGQYEQAITVFEKELQLSLDDTDTYYLLGMVYATASTNYQRAIENLNRYLTLRPRAAERDQVFGMLRQLTKLSREQGK